MPAVKTSAKPHLTIVTDPRAIASIEANDIRDIVGAKQGGVWVAIKSTVERWKRRLRAEPRGEA